MSLKMDWKKQLMRVKQTKRNDRSESHGDPIVKLEERIDQIRQACQAVGKKLLACLQLHGVEQDKYQKKLPEFILSNQLLETSRTFGKQDALGETFSLCAEAEQKMAEKRWDYEKDLESKVMTPLQIMLEKDIPAIVKLRKQVSKLTQDFDTAKSKYLAAQRQTQSLSGQNAISTANAKNDQLREDMEDAENKLEQMKDQLATEVFNFYAHEGELNNVLLQIIETQSVYYRSIVDVLDDALPKIKHQIGKSAKRPVYGCSLDDHLQHSGRTIASVIEECTTTLQKVGMDEEGLFRIAGGTTKVRKLKAAFDANLVDMDDFTTDPHCIAGALKLYLRELPEPLMTFELYSEWMKVLNLPADQKVPALASVLNKMNKSRLDNLSYLIKFLARLAANSSVNKMSANNIAIVVGPNLIWSSHNDRSSIQAIAAQSAVVELLIANANTLFFAKDECASVSPQQEDTTSTAQQHNGSSPVPQPATTTPTFSLSVVSPKPIQITRTTSLSRAESAKRRSQAQKDFWCSKNNDSASVRSWPERPVQLHHKGSLNLKTVNSHADAKRHSSMAGRTVSNSGLSLSVFDGSLKMRATPPKSVHSDMYNTAFALQSLGDVNWPDYLSRVRTMWDSHLETEKRWSLDFSRSWSVSGEVNIDVTPDPKATLSGFEKLTPVIAGRTDLILTSSYSEFSRPSNVAAYETLTSADAMQTSVLSSDSSLSSTNQPYSKESIPKFGSSSSLSSDTTWPEVYASISSIDDPASLKTATGDSDSGDRTPHAPRRRKAMAPMPPPMFSDNANEASQETTSLSGTEEEAVVSNQTKFAISQALVSGVLNKPKKMLLTRPTTAYADNSVALVPLARSFSSSADPVDLLEHDSNSGKMEKNGSGDHSRLSETSSLDSSERRRYEDTARMKPKVPPPPRPDPKETKPLTGGISRVSTNHGSTDPELQTAIAHENHHGSETSKLPDAKTLERQNSETSQSVEGDTRKPHRPSKPQRPAPSKQEQKSVESAIAGFGDEVPIAVAGVIPAVTEASVATAIVAPVVTPAVTGASVAAAGVTPTVTPAVTRASVAATGVAPAVTSAVTGASVAATGVTPTVTSAVTGALVTASVTAASIASTGSSVEATVDAAVPGEDEVKSNGGIVGGAKPRKPPPPVVRPSMSNESEVEKRVVEEDTYL